MDVEDAKDLERYMRDKRRAEAKNKLSETAQLCNCIGEIYSKYGRYEDASQEHKQERHLSEALGDKIGEAVACRKIGECLCCLGQYAEALGLQKKHLTIARECGNHLEEQRAWATIGRTYLSQSETRNLQESLLASKKAEKAFVKALEACDKVKGSVKLNEYMAMKGRIYLNIGLVYDVRGEIKLSADVLKRAVTIAEKFKLDDELYMCHSSLANMYQKCNNYSQALRSLEVALRLAQKLRNKVWEKEMFVQKAITLVSTGDFLAAKHCLKKAHKLKVDSEVSKKKLINMFCCVNNMQEAIQDLGTETDEKKIAKLYEVVADGAAELGNYKEAIENYLKVIHFGHLLTSDERAAIYVSLAQSYADIRDYESAVTYYNHELEERKDNPEQLCRTMLNIAELEELKGSKYPTICKIYMNAFDAAKRAKHPRLQVQTLKSLIELQKISKQMTHQQETEKKLTIILKKYNLQDGTNDDEEDNSSEDTAGSDDVDKDNTKEKDGDISLSDLTVSDESEGDQENAAGNSSAGRKKSKLARRNEKGETPLHRACIDGNLKKVKSLIAEGHPVNPRDYCGWLPLHEASNHGHFGVVEHLLYSGAWINDRGGERCGGVTPLIDAANCGNLDVVKVLVERGANVLAKDDDGNTALDSLHSWYSRTGEVLGPTDEKEYRVVEKLLSSKMGNGASTSTDVRMSKTKSMSSATARTGRITGRAVAAPPKKSKLLPDLTDDSDEDSSDVEQPVRGSKRSSQPYKERLTILRQKRENRQNRKRQHMDESGNPQTSDEEMSDDDHRLQCSPPVNDTHNPSAATDVYRSTISHIGSSAQRRMEAEDVSANSEDGEDGRDKTVPALLAAEEDVGDSWLINDLKYPKTKKKSTAVQGILTTTSSRTNTADRRKRIRTEERDTEKTSKLPTLTEKRRKSTHSADDENSYSSSLSRGSKRFTSERVHFDESSNETCPVSSSTEAVKNTRNTTNISEKHHYAWDSDDDILCQVDTVFDDSQYDTSLTTSSQNPQQNKTSLQSSVVATAVDMQRQGEVISAANEGNRASNEFVNRNINSPQNQRDSYGTENLHTQSSSRDLLTKLAQALDKSSSKQIESVSQHIEESFQKPTYKNSMRIKVKFSDQTLLIPIQPADQEKRLAWLIQQARERYFNMFLMLPTLTLSTQDGTILCPSDTISMVLLDGEVLTANVSAWERPKLEDRYTQACNLSLTAPAKHVSAALQQCDLTGHLQLGDMGLGFSILQPVFQALEGQKTLVELRLNGNRLGDSIIEPLMKVLSGLPILKVLMLDTNGLTADGIRSMALVLKSHSCLQSVTTLSLSHNSLDDIVAESLAVVIAHLPKLNTLNLSSCNFSSKLFTDSVREAFKACSLAQVNMAENQIEDAGIISLLSVVHPDCLQNLDISYTRSSHNQDMSKYLQDFIDKGFSCLRELSLAGCHLSEADVVFVNRLPVMATSLRSLSISQNQKVNNKSLQKLLYLSADGHSKLEELTVRGCSVISPLDSELIEAVRRKMMGEVPLKKFAFSCRGLKSAEMQILQGIWMDKWCERGQVKTVGMSVTLNVI